MELLVSMLGYHVRQVQLFLKVAVNVRGHWNSSARNKYYMTFGHFLDIQSAAVRSCNTNLPNTYISYYNVKCNKCLV